MSMPEVPADAPIPFALPDITEAEVDAVTEVLRSRWLTTGARTREFEQRFAQAVGSPHAVALNSCTAALHLSLEALGIQPGDHVYVPTYTFASSAEVVRYLGAVPVLVDVERASSNLDPEALRVAVRRSREQGARPAAVIPVHISGVACDLDEIWQIAREHDLAVVEDAAHAFPASFRGRTIGSMPEDVRGTVCFSFYATKTITTGEGGMVTTEDQALADRIRVMSLHGLSREAWNRYTGGTWRYDIIAPGYKYNLTDMASALGMVQLARADEMTKRRSEIAQSYHRGLADLEQLELPTVPDDRVSSWHLYLLRLAPGSSEDQRDRLIDGLKAVGVGTEHALHPVAPAQLLREDLRLRPRGLPGRARQLPSRAVASDLQHDDRRRGRPRHHGCPLPGGPDLMRFYFDDAGVFSGGGQAVLANCHFAAERHPIMQGSAASGDAPVLHAQRAAGWGAARPQVRVGPAERAAVVRARHRTEGTADRDPAQGRQ